MDSGIIAFLHPPNPIQYTSKFQHITILNLISGNIRYRFFVTKLIFVTYVVCKILYFPFRWNNGRGDTINHYNEWFRGGDLPEPDLLEFDYNLRKYSPMTETAFKSCSSSPAYQCYSGGAPCRKACPKNEISNGGCKKGQCGCQAGFDCTSSTNPLFVDFQTILETTEDSLPACIAMYGPTMVDKVLQQITSGVFTNIDSCGVVADTILDKHYLTWADVKCSQKTRAQICVMTGK